MSLFFNQPTPLFGQNPFPQWQREMNDLFSRFNKDFENNRLFQSSLTPDVELLESEKSYQVMVEVPGVSDADLKVSLKDNKVIIEGVRKQPEHAKNFQVSSTEMNYGDIYREILLGEEVNANTIKATCHDGILNITLDKLEPSLHQVKRIPIQKS
jgi:HSP20 family protein